MFLVVFQRNQKRHRDRVNSRKVFYLALSDPAEPRTSSVQRGPTPETLAATSAHRCASRRRGNARERSETGALRQCCCLLQTSHSQHSLLKHNKTFCSSEGARTPGPKRRDPPLLKSALGHTLRPYKGVVLWQPGGREGVVFS